MKIFLFAAVLGLLSGCLLLPQEKKIPEPVDAVREANECAAVHILNDADGNLIFAPVFTDRVCTLTELPELLRAHSYHKVSLSSWVRHADYAAITDSLLRAGIGINMFYVLSAGRKDWDRRDLIENIVPEPEEPVPARPPLTVRLIEDNAYNRRYKRPGPMPFVETITIHNTAEPFTARQERDRVDYRRDRRSVSYHFAVDEDEIVQLLPLSEHGWHAGDGSRGPGNTRSIGIEICRSQCRGHADWRYRRAEENAVKLTAALLQHFGLTPDAIRMHQNWNGKYCPHRILEENRFEEFRQRVKNVLENSRSEAILSGDTFKK